MRACPRRANDPENLEYALAPLILYSDSTHLTNFGTASLWPMYAYPANQSKYTRGRPSMYSAHHVAYVPSLPDDFQDWYTRIYGQPATAEVLTFVRRELFQGILLLLLSDDVMSAYDHGYKMLCG
ncbi:hypothetical protein BD309DRAFT_930000, partial [Dichomitus squalens]